MSDRGGERMDELARRLGQTVNEICELEQEKIHLTVQKELALQKCEVLNIEVAELDGLIVDVKYLQTNATVKNEELR